MIHQPLSAPACLGNTRDAAWIGADGRVEAFSMTPGRPSEFGGHGGEFLIAPEGAITSVTRTLLGETAVLETLYVTPTGTASVLDFLPVRVGPTGDVDVPRLSKPRLIRVVEGREGIVTMKAVIGPRPEGAAPLDVALDANGLLFRGEQTSICLHSEAEVHLGEHGAEARFSIGPGEKRHFVVTALPGPDPDVPEMRANEPDWELDATLDFWVQWGRRCPFQGVQRPYVMRLAVLAAALSDADPAVRREALGEQAMVAPIALAAWGWEGALAAAIDHWSSPDAATDAAAAAWAFDALASGQAEGLIEASPLVHGWPGLGRHVQTLTDAQPENGPRRAALLAGLLGLAVLEDELFLSSGSAARRARVASTDDGGAAPLGDEAFARALEVERDFALTLTSVRQALAEGGYLQARRRMDAWLVAFDPLAAARGCELAVQALWLAARIYLVAPPVPKRVELPGDLGD